MEINETHKRITKLLEEKGPCLPIQIARELNMNSLFISAFLSELVDSKTIKVSSLKVGGSPLYFLRGQEEMLENFYKYLHPREAEAFLLLKKNKTLKDSEAEPAIRVALRQIKDFAVPFNKNDEVFWKYMFVPDSEIKKTKPKQEKKPLAKPTSTKKTQEKPEVSEFENPLVITNKKKQKQKSDFVLKVIDFLQNNNFKILQEKDFKQKEYNCILQINSQLGLINFLLQAKDKKTISEADLKKLLSTAQKIPLPAFMLFSGDIGKKALTFQEKYNSILKLKKI
jgi:hypothetical protein